MLTKQDLGQIQKVVQTETRTIVQQETRKIVREVLQEELKPIKKDVSTLKEDVAQIRSDMKLIVRFFDREYITLRRRVERIETHLDLHPAS